MAEVGDDERKANAGYVMRLSVKEKRKAGAITESHPRATATEILRVEPILPLC